MWDWRKILGAVLAVVAASVWIANMPKDPAPAPPKPPVTTSEPTTTGAPTTTVDTTTTTVTPTVGGCALLRTAAEGATVTLNGPLGDDDCTLYQPPKNVTVTGTTSGNLRCDGCDGWHIDHLELVGMLRMLGGHGWSITHSHLDGNDAGTMSVLNVGRNDPPIGNPIDWTVSDTVIERPGDGPGNVGRNWDHAVYIIAGNGENLNGLLERVTIHGSGYGVALKIGGTGNYGYVPFGPDPGAPDSADGVTVRDSTITNVAGADDTCVGIGTDSDQVTLDGVTFDCPHAVWLAGPFTGTNTGIVNSTDKSQTWLTANVYPQGTGYAQWQLAYAQPAIFGAWGPRWVTLGFPDCGWVAGCSNNTHP